MLDFVSVGQWWVSNYKTDENTVLNCAATLLCLWKLRNNPRFQGKKHGDGELVLGSIAKMLKRCRVLIKSANQEEVNRCTGCQGSHGAHIQSSFETWGFSLDIVLVRLQRCLIGRADDAHNSCSAK